MPGLSRQQILKPAQHDPEFGEIGRLAVLGASGHYLLIKALQLAPASVLQPFSYTVLVWTMLVGFLVFGNLPDLATILGALVIVASGLYSLARQRRRGDGG